MAFKGTGRGRFVAFDRERDEGELIPELRQWDCIMMMKGKKLDADGVPKPIRRDVFNAIAKS